MIDLSRVFCSDLDEGQAVYDQLPEELKLHLARCFGHAAGLCEDPGIYLGPVPEILEEEDEEWE
jgi:hypothetical protein